MNDAFHDELGPALSESIDNAPDMPPAEPSLDSDLENNNYEGEYIEEVSERPMWVNVAAVALGLLTVGAIAYKALPRRAKSPQASKPTAGENITSLDAYNQFIKENPDYL